MSRKPPSSGSSLSPGLRRAMSIGAVVGGIIGIALARIFGWDDLQTFVITLIIAGGLALVTGALLGRRLG